MHALALTASDAALWVFVASSVIASLATGVVAVVAALKGQKADAKADVLNSRADALASHAQSLDRQMTEVARAMPPPAADPTVQIPPAGPSATMSGFPIAGYPTDRPKP